MKRFLCLALLTVLLGTAALSSAHSFGPVHPVHDATAANKTSFSSGWYTATVENQNSTTFTDQSYQLQVFIQDGQVTVIDFGNGSQVRAGINTEGYTYTGGILIVKAAGIKKKISGTTTILLKDSIGTGAYKITI